MRLLCLHIRSFTLLFLITNSLFYVNGVKVVPSDIFNLETRIALAHWIMGDSALPTGLLLCTDSFTTPDVVRLMNVLMVRYRLARVYL